MNDDEIWTAIDIQRLRTAELLESLTEDEWGQPSLCDGWTVRDVAAHLTLQQLGLRDVLRFALRHPTSMLGINRVIATDVIRQVLRAFFTPEAMPSVHHSAFDAGGLEGYAEQAAHVATAAEAMVERAVNEAKPACSATRAVSARVGAIRAGSAGVEKFQ